MMKKPVTKKAPVEQVVKDIRRATRKLHCSEEKIRIVLSGLSRGAIQKAGKASQQGVYGDGSINATASDVRRAGMTDPDQHRRDTGSDSRFIARPTLASVTA